METLKQLRLRPHNTVEGFDDTFEAGVNCARIQYESGAYFVFRPLTKQNQTLAYDLIITAHGHGRLEWREECPTCGEVLASKKALASHMFHRHQQKMKEEAKNAKR